MYNSHYIPSLENQHLVINQILDKPPIELYYFERSVFRKVVTTNNVRILELGNSRESTQTHLIVGFQARYKIDSHLLNNSTLDQFQGSSAVCKIGSEKYPDDGIECDNDRDNYHQACHKIETFFNIHSQTNLPNPFISLLQFRTDYTFYVFDHDRDNYHQAFHKIETFFNIHSQTNLLNPFISLLKFRTDYTFYVFDHDRDNYHQACHKIETFFNIHSQTNLLNPFISLLQFRTDYTFYVLDLSQHKPAIESQLI